MSPPILLFASKVNIWISFWTVQVPWTLLDIWKFLARGSQLKANKKKREEVWFEVSGKWVLLVVLISFWISYSYQTLPLYFELVFSKFGWWNHKGIHHVSVGKGLIILSIYLNISRVSGCKHPQLALARLDHPSLTVAVFTLWTASMWRYLWQRLSNDK